MIRALVPLTSMMQHGNLRDAKMRLKVATRYRAKFWGDLVCRAFLQWKEDSDCGVQALVAKQGLLYNLIAAAINFCHQPHPAEYPGGEE